jgi:hypothetical protein
VRKKTLRLLITWNLPYEPKAAFLPGTQTKVGKMDGVGSFDSGSTWLNMGDAIRSPCAAASGVSVECSPRDLDRLEHGRPLLCEGTITPR